LERRRRLWFGVLIIALVCTAGVLVALIFGHEKSNPAVGQTAALSEAVPTESTLPAVSATATPVPTTPPDTVSEPAEVTFIESKELHLPNLDEDLQYGQPFHLCGMVQSNVPLKSVTVTVSREASDNPIYPVVGTVTFKEKDQVLTYSLENAETPLEDGSFTSLIPFEKLESGLHEYTITVETVFGERIGLVSASFAVAEESEWLQLISNNFRDNYQEALNFFGDKSEFLFKYKWGEARHIIIDPEWVEKHIVSMPGLAGKTWKVHADAEPYFQKAIDYVESTYVRVHSKGHDSGVIRLEELVKSSNGTYVSRYVTDRTFISHHAFGTAVDINAYMEPNNNVLENRDIIRAEVGKLTYNGIKKDDGHKYYDFSYAGDWPDYYQEVPTSLLNYLLYELAFYRAGFGWGYYYMNTCDGMHFTLTERNIAEFSDSKTGLRKVYEYADDLSADGAAE
jgi:hypothetical protein